MMHAAWVLARKDLRTFIRDRGALVLSLLVPIALVSIFGWIMAFAFGGSGGMPRVGLHVYDDQQSAESERFIEQLSNIDMLRLEHIAQGELSDEELQNARVGSRFSAEHIEAVLRKLISGGDAHHVLWIPDSFDEQLSSGQVPDLRLLRDPGRQMEDRIVQLAIAQASIAQYGGGVFNQATERLLREQGMEPTQVRAVRDWMENIESTISDFASQQAAAETSSEEGDEGDPDSDSRHSDGEDVGRSAEGSEVTTDNEDIFAFMSEMMPLQTTDIQPPNRSRQVTYQQAQSVAGMSVMMLLFALTSCGSVLLVEREDGTLKRLFVQPISRHAILLGKFLFVLIVGAMQMTILFVCGEWMFQVGLFRDPLTLTVLTLSWVATGGSFGIFLATVSRSSKQAEGLATLLILMMAALGGCWFPLQMMDLPPLLETICKCTMTYWAMTGFQGMLWNQLPWHSEKLLEALAWQWAWVVGLTLLSIYFYRRNYCRG